MTPLILVMGVSGVGKTTIGQSLATELGAEFRDADDYHSPQSRAKMARGEPLTDDDRQGWLDRLHQLLLDQANAGRPTVLACSALRERYRQRLSEQLPQLQTVYLQSDFATIQRRLRERTGHFMPATLLESQFATLEEPQDAVVVDASQDPEAVVAAALRSLRSAANGGTVRDTPR